MTDTRYPHRVRIHGGRVIHAARPINGGADRTTACGYYLPHGSDNDWRDEATTVGCTRCVRQQQDEESY